MVRAGCFFVHSRQQLTFNIIMKRNNKRGDYVSPDASVIEIEMQDLIAASNDASFDVNGYTSGYGEEEIF